MTTPGEVAATRREREAALRRGIATGGGLPVERVVPLRWSAPGGLGAGAVAVEDAMPAEAVFATLALLSEEALGYPMRSYQTTATGMAERVSRLQRAEYQVQFYRPGAAAAAERYVAWLWTPAGLISSEAAEYRLDAGGYRRVDALIADAWEERAVVDLTCRWWQTHAEPAGEIAAAEGIRVISDIGPPATVEAGEE